MPASATPALAACSRSETVDSRFWFRLSAPELPDKEWYGDRKGSVSRVAAPRATTLPAPAPAAVGHQQAGALGCSAHPVIQKQLIDEHDESLSNPGCALRHLSREASMQRCIVHGPVPGLEDFAIVGLEY